MAYFAWIMVQGLCLYSFGREQSRKGTPDPSYFSRMDADRILAWSGVEFHDMGIVFAVLLTIEKLWLLERLRKSRVLSHFYTLFFVLVSFVIFNAETLGQAVSDIGGLFGAGGIPLVSKEALYCLRSFAVILAVGMIGATPAVRIIAERIMKKSMGEKILYIAEPVAWILLLLVMTAYLVDGSFNPFLYFRF